MVWVVWVVWVVWEVLGGFQEKANCPLDLKDLLNLTHYLTLPLAAGNNKSISVVLQ